MLAALKKAAVWAVICVIALHSLAAAAVSPGQAALWVGETSVICHSDPTGGGPQAPQPDDPSGDCCSHCVLCGGPPMAGNVALAAELEPFRSAVRIALAPRSTLRLAGSDRPAHSARGPPEAM